ncbi:M15 family metallopeptidase [Georgenia yuyongxinii]|uniref:M15 family metallopeptidase n=1 Tax=Georgenia yuyongxinii TaxID=2589797 RepID=UPI001CB7562C|nr:M15 family metallopeptidase [Georgenia yuyongxinii]
MGSRPLLAALAAGLLVLAGCTPARGPTEPATGPATSATQTASPTPPSATPPGGPTSGAGVPTSTGAVRPAKAPLVVPAPTPAAPAPSRSATSPTPGTTEPAPTSPGPTSSPPAPVPPPFHATVAAVSEADLASWHAGCPVSPADLRSVTLTRWTGDGAASGTIVVAAAVADDVVGVMQALYEARFPIARMEPVEAFGGDDDASMAANNTSAFNCRAVTGGSSWSEHSYGRAIDLNPLVNPYVLGSTVLPAGGAAYADRTLQAPGMIHDGDAVVRAFATRGWVWGGTWSSPKDYQHFSTTGR